MKNKTINVNVTFSTSLSTKDMPDSVKKLIQHAIDEDEEITDLDEQYMEAFIFLHDHVNDSDAIDISYTCADDEE